VHSVGKTFWSGHGIDVEREIERLNADFEHITGRVLTADAGVGGVGGAE